MAVPDDATVYCIVPVRNRRSITLDFVRQWSAQTYSRRHLVIVDDASNDGTPQALINILPSSQLTLLHCDGNAWWGGAIYAGIEALRSRFRTEDYVLFMNDDVEFSQDFVEQMMLSAADDPLLVLGANQKAHSGKSLGAGFMIDFWKVQFVSRRLGSGMPINALPARGLLFPANAVSVVGNVRKHLFRHYLCDLDYSFRLADAGYRLAICERAIVVTDDESSDAASNQKISARRFGFRSKDNLAHRILFFKKNGPCYLRYWLLPRLAFFSICRRLIGRDFE